MAIFKPAAPQSPKQIPKRGSKTLNFSPTSDGAEETIIVDAVDAPNDDHLQSLNCRRRYMRRGSRAPSMFLRSNFSSLELPLEQEDDCTEPETCGQQRFQRRLSITSLLSQQLKQNAVLESSQEQTTHNSEPSISTFKLQRKNSVPTNE